MRTLPVPRSVTDVAVTSDPGADGAYAIGEAVAVTVTFSEPMTVTTAGNPVAGPRIALTLGTETRHAAYSSGSGGTDLVFRYTVAEGDADTDGIAVAADALELNGGAIAAGDGNAAALAHTALAAQAGHKVDGVRPTVASASVTGTALTVTFDEPLGAADSLANGAFAVKRTPKGGTEGSVDLAGSPAISGATLTLTLAEAAMFTDTDIKVSYTRPTAGSGNAVVDAAGNAAESFAEQAVANDSPPSCAEGNQELVLPSHLTLTATDSTVTVSYDNQSPVSQRFQLCKAGSSAVAQDSGLTGETTWTFAGLDPDTDHWVRAQEFSTGFSNWKHVRTLPAPPSVTGVTVTSDPGSDGAYAIGEAIALTVAFDGNVTVTTAGDPVAGPRIAVVLGTETRFATYASGSGETDLVFRYTVAEGDADADGIATGANRLVLSGGAIRDGHGQAAALAHAALAAQPGHRVDGVRPEPESASTNGTTLTVTFDEPLGAAASLANGAFTVKRTPQGGTEGNADLAGSPTVSGRTVTLTLAAALEGTDTDIKVSYAKPAAGSGNAVVDAAGNAAESFADQDVTNFSGSAAHADISAVTVVSRPRLDADGDGTNDTYGAGQKIVLDVTWDEAVTWDASAAGAEVRVRLDIGGTRRFATLATGGETTGSGSRLRFAYTVAAGDRDVDGFAVATGSGGNVVTLRSGAVLTDAGGADARRRHPGLSAGAGHRVNGSAAAPANKAPVFDNDDDPDTDNRDLGLVPTEGGLPSSVAAAESDFSDPDGDPLTFTLGTSRPDVFVTGAPRWHRGRIDVIYRHGCQFANLSPPITASPFHDAVTLTASDPEGASVEVTMRTRTPFTRCPAFASASVNGATLAVTFDGDLVFGVPGADEFEVRVDGTVVPLAATGPVTRSGRILTLALAWPVTEGQAVTVSYAPDAEAMTASSAKVMCRGGGRLLRQGGRQQHAGAERAVRPGRPGHRPAGPPDADRDDVGGHGLVRQPGGCRPDVPALQGRHERGRAGLRADGRDVVDLRQPGRRHGPLGAGEGKRQRVLELEAHPHADRAAVGDGSDGVLGPGRGRHLRHRRDNRADGGVQRGGDGDDGGRLRGGSAHRVHAGDGDAARGLRLGQRHAVARVRLHGGRGRG